MTDPLNDAITETDALAQLDRHRQERGGVVRTRTTAAHLRCGECDAVFIVIAAIDAPSSGVVALQAHTVAVHGRPASPAERTPVV